MNTAPLFEPSRVQHLASSPMPAGAGGDRRDGRVYVYYRSDIALAVNVALATHRPLLLSGPSGCGKSSLALNVALSLGWRYYEQVITARSEARDLLWNFDSLRRLSDAQARDAALRTDECYLEPGILWWAFDPHTAEWRGAEGRISPADKARDPSLTGAKDKDNAVVLIDEIDKADPDLPNNLLVPLGSLQFKVEPTRFSVIGALSPLIFITTNRERDLPQAFLRRCVAYQLSAPTTDELVEIAAAIFPAAEHDEVLFRRVAERVTTLAGETERDTSTAEYIDILRACMRLGIRPESESFLALSRITLQKDIPGGGPWD